MINMESLLSADSDLVSSIDRDFQQDGAGNFTVAVSGSFRYNNLVNQEGYDEEYRHPMTVSCDNVMVGRLASNKTAAGALVGGSSRKCKAHIDSYVYARIDSILGWNYIIGSIYSHFICREK